MLYLLVVRLTPETPVALVLLEHLLNPHNNLVCLIRVIVLNKRKSSKFNKHIVLNNCLQ